MNPKGLFFILGLSFTLNGYSQIVIKLSQTSDRKESVNNETFTKTPSGEVNIIKNVSEPTITVYLPDAKLATGAAVILCPGGAMRVLSWNNDVIKMAKWLNSHGIAAIGLKYSLMQNSSIPMPKDSTKPYGAPFRVDIADYQKFNKANANPSTDPEGTEIVFKAAAEAKEAIIKVRQHAKEWNINPNKIGFLGFSAGGGVAIAATVLHSEGESRPDFLAINYGPSLIDVSVPKNAPPLFVCSNVDHPNVAAGCTALFMEWKKTGNSAEMHLFSGGKGGYSIDKQENTSDAWSELFLNWLKAQGFQKK